MMKDKNGKLLTPIIYFDMCKNHDWYYEMTEDINKWRKGVSSYLNLKHCFNEYPFLKPIYQAFYDYHFSGEHFGTEKKDMPTLKSLKLS